MNQSLLAFYSGRGDNRPDPVPVPPPVVTDSAPSAQPHAVPCSYGATTGCQLAFRSKPCCHAVQGHLCDPPSEILPSFTKGRGPMTMAQVYIANGCHR